MFPILLLLPALSLGDPDPADLEFFEKSVRPVLARRCQGCHGPEKQKGDLRLDSRDAALAGGKAGPAVVPGKPDESVLIEAINYGDLVQMPPKSKLPPEEIAVLTKWVEKGAPWPAEVKTSLEAPKSKIKPFDLKERAKHWSFQPVRKVDPPAVRDAAWAVTPIDRFLISAIEAKGLKPAADTDKRTLIRRATYDLTGLPPTPAEIDAFLADDRPDAFARVVDRLLASPRYGERWGRHWLDLVRYAETYGHEFDYDIPDAWRYRDYVIRAFNDDLPYDRFVTEHVAGDLIETPRRHPKDGTNESILGTGFFFLGEGTHSPVDVRDDEVLKIDNQIDVLSKTFLGLTVSCARCHDHKFDAISTNDYYALAGYFQSSRHQHAIIDPPNRFAAQIAELDALKAKIAASATGGGDASTYFEAARRILASATSTADGDILFDDFEGDQYVRWTASGTAFGDGPIHLPVPDYQGDVHAHGNGLVGSHNGRVSGSVTDRDALTGMLTSDEFPVDRDFIHALIGGGSHAGKTCVNVRIDGKVVLSQTGRDENFMRPHVFDVRPWKGKTARLQVVDDDTGGWGNISLDHVVFSDRAEPPDSPLRRVATEATRSKLDPDRLSRWVHVLKAIGTVRDAEEAGGSVVFEDFSGPSLGDWTVSGDAFTRPTGPGAFRVGDAGPIPVPPGVAHSGLVSDRLEGVLRSRTFPIEHKYIHLLTWGRSGRINLIVDGFEKIRDPIYGGLTAGVDSPAPKWVTIDASMWIGHNAYLELGDGAMADFTQGTTRYYPGNGFLAVDEIRFSDAPPPGRTSSPSLEEVAIAAGAAPSRRDGKVAAFFAENGLIAAGTDLSALIGSYRQAESTITPPALGLAILDGTPEDEHVLIRGSSKTPGPVVPRRFLEAIAGPDQSPPSRGSGRLELAQRMLDPSCPLPARVMVNRLWKHHFGVGLVKSTDDFGVMGEPPSHPELLDWLATEFRARGWSIKAMHREMMLSHAYRMASAIDPVSDAIDPANRLLHRANVRRLEAEAIRDAMLFVSGRLDVRMGGPSVPPYLTPLMEGRGRPASSGPLDGDGRRSLYLGIRRNFLPPMLLAFDFPAPASTMGRRNVSNVPAQGLTMLNDPFVLGQAKLWADRILASGKTTGERLDFAYVSASARPPIDTERSDAEAFLAGHEDDAHAWADLAHVLFNVKEFLFLP